MTVTKLWDVEFSLMQHKVFPMTVTKLWDVEFSLMQHKVEDANSINKRWRV